MTERRTFAPEMKREICRQLVSGEKRLAQICREHALAESVVIRWRKTYQQCGVQAFVINASVEPAHEARIAELERFCGQLALENQVLKKPCKLLARGAASHDARDPDGLSAACSAPVVRAVWGQSELVV